jgi:hypothetical protein
MLVRVLTPHQLSTSSIQSVIILKYLNAAAVVVLFAIISVVAFSNNDSGRSSEEMTEAARRPQFGEAAESVGQGSGPRVTKSRLRQLGDSVTLSAPTTSRNLVASIPHQADLRQSMHSGQDSHSDVVGSKRSKILNLNRKSTYGSENETPSDLGVSESQDFASSETGLGVTSRQPNQPSASAGTSDQLESRPSIASVLLENLSDDRMDLLGEHESVAVTELGNYVAAATVQLNSGTGLSDSEKILEEAHIASESNSYLRASLGFARFNQLSFLAAAEAAATKADQSANTDRKFRRF